MKYQSLEDQYLTDHRFLLMQIRNRLHFVVIIVWNHLIDFLLLTIMWIEQ